MVMTQPSVPDIATLRRLCHGEKLARDPRPVYVVTRRISIHLTWLLLHTRLSPNQVTSLTVLLGVLGSGLLAMPGGGWALAGGIAFLLHHLTDKVDGDIARFRRTFSIIGVYLDELGHGLAFSGIFVGLGLHLAWGAGSATRVALLVAAAAGALAMVLGRHHKSIGFQLYAQHVVGHPELIPRGANQGPARALTRSATHRDRREGGSRSGWMGTARDFALQLSDFSLLVVLILVGAAVEMGSGSQTLLRWVLFGEAALQIAVFIAVVSVNVAVNVESEVRRLAAAEPSSAGPPGAPDA